MKLQTKYKGLNTLRLKENPLEAKFAQAWQEMGLLSARPETGMADNIDYLLHVGDQHRVPPCSDRDRLVANTVIQWLGSPVGECFVEEVTRDSAQRRATERTRLLEQAEITGTAEIVAWLKKNT